MNPNKKGLREKKIADLLELINGNLSPTDIRMKKQLISIDWGEDDDTDEGNIFMIDGKRVDRSTFKNEMTWRAENKK